jgi:tripartite-type tricarboxylate transporter receptor subunit TctC
VHDAIASGSWKSALFTTFTLSLTYLESHVISALRQAGCESLSIMVDVAGYRDSLVELKSRSVGRDYAVVSIRVKGGIFHRCACGRRPFAARPSNPAPHFCSGFGLRRRRTRARSSTDLRRRWTRRAPRLDGSFAEAPECATIRKTNSSNQKKNWTQIVAVLIIAGIGVHKQETKNMPSNFARRLLLVAFASVPLLSFSQPYPSAPITLIVPFAAGSGTDAVARIVGAKLSERLKQPVVIENKAGANGQIAAEAVAKAKADGYTLFMTTNTSHSANPSLYRHLRYDPIKDFTPVAGVGELPFALVVNTALPVKSMRDLIIYAKSNPNKLSYGTPNSTSLVAMETIKRIAGIDVLSIPYKSSPQAMSDVIAGSIQIYVSDLGSGLNLMKAGRVRTLAITTAKPSPLLPGVPPLSDAVPGFDLTSWNGIFGPAGLPKSVVDRLNKEIQVVLADKATQDKLSQLGFQVWPSKTPAEFSAYVSQQLNHWATLIKQANIQPE